MQKKKSLLEEVDKTWQLAKLIKEANPAPIAAGKAQAQPAQTQTQGQRAPQQTQAPQPAGQQTQMSPQQVDKNAETTLTQALASTVKNLPAILKNFTATAGDKDNKIDAAGITPPDTTQAPAAQTNAQAPQAKPIQENTLKFNEEEFSKHHKDDLNEAGILGLVLSAPTIVKWAGIAASKLGKKLDAKWLEKAGHWAEHQGHAWHQGYINLIAAALKPFMPGVPEDKIQKTAEALLVVVIGTLFAQGLANPGVLTAVKSGELASYIQKSLPAVMSQVGFA
jgi:hypothetical protein